jgi:hypothetical protein
MLLDDIGNYLKSQGLIPSGTFLFYGAMADTTIVNGQTVKTDNCICLYETVGYAPDLNFDNENVEYPGLQIICRGISYAETRGRIDEVYKKLHGNG